VLVADVFIGLALLAVALTVAAVVLPLWLVAIVLVGLLTGVVHGAEWALVRAGALRCPRLSPPLRRALDRLLHPLPPRPPDPPPPGIPTPFSPSGPPMCKPMGLGPAASVADAPHSPSLGPFCDGRPRVAER
jgi:hypothetical protein